MKKEGRTHTLSYSTGQVRVSQSRALFYAIQQHEKKRSPTSFYKIHSSLLVYPDCRGAAPLWSDLLDLAFAASQV